MRARNGGRPWWEWPGPQRWREPSTVRRAQIEDSESIRQIEFEQYLFHRQWNALRNYAHQKGVLLFGDVPIYVAADSVEAWQRPELFKMDTTGNASHVSGVPPDYFSENGQFWGNPIYDWEQMRSEDFRWWVDRLRHQLTQHDILRIDHFRALEAYWEIPASAMSAREGRWVKGPGDAFLRTVGTKVPLENFVAEDLGMITDEVRQLRTDWDLPGMLVLQFAFDGSPSNPFLPENHVERAVVYTGTHDNNTTVGWYESLDENARRFVDHRLGIPPQRIPEVLIHAAYASPATLAVVPMQDLLELGSEHRMNTPGTDTGNWQWRFQWSDLGPDLAIRYRRLAESFGRI